MAKISVFGVAQKIVSIEPMPLEKLQLICFVAQGKSLAEKKHELFPEELEAWAKLPVVRKLQERFSQADGDIVPEDFLTGRPESISEEAEKLLEQVVSQYGNMSALEIAKCSA